MTFLERRSRETSACPITAGAPAKMVERLSPRELLYEQHQTLSCLFVKQSILAVFGCAANPWECMDSGGPETGPEHLSVSASSILSWCRKGNITGVHSSSRRQPFYAWTRGVYAIYPCEHLVQRVKSHKRCRQPLSPIG